MVALVRAGVTATCSGADKPRYGDLDVDSNLPDTRIALGGPTRNAFTEAVLAQADPIYTKELDRQLAETGRARVWVPAATPLASVWRPGADLRAVRALPVLVIDGSDEKSLGAAIASVTDDLADAQIVVSQQAPADMEPFDARSVALLNRGVPSFAVETDGTLHTALMRSCTGWPSGVWIDEPRRTTPDGSNFQLQHWTHVFDYALVSGDGDWRNAQIPSRSAQFSHPLLAVVAPGPQGRLAPVGSLLHVDPADAVHLGALKAAGNPLASGSAAPVDPGTVAVRLVETTGNSTRVAVGSELGTVRALQLADLLETPQGRKRAVDLHGYQVATVRARLEVPELLAGPSQLAPQAEVAQPLYARYWLHNRGPAPLGGLPAVAHLHPQSATAEPGDEGGAAADCGQRLQRRPAERHRGRGVSGWLEGQYPPSCRSRCAPPSTWRPTSCLRFRVARNRAPTPSGRSCASPTPEAPEAWRQVVEDVCVVQVGARHEAELVYLLERPGRHRPGGRRYRAADRHGGQPGLRRAGVGGASDQPLGHLGVDRPGRVSAPRCPPAARSNSASTWPLRSGWSLASGGPWCGSAAPAGCSTHRRCR